MEYLVAASASFPGFLPRLSSPSAEKHMCNVLGREASEGPNNQGQAHTARQGHPFEDVINSRRERACSQRR